MFMYDDSLGSVHFKWSDRQLAERSQIHIKYWTHTHTLEIYESQSKTNNETQVIERKMARQTEHRTYYDVFFFYYVRDAKMLTKKKQNKTWSLRKLNLQERNTTTTQQNRILNEFRVVFVLQTNFNLFQNIRDEKREKHIQIL